MKLNMSTLCAWLICSLIVKLIASICVDEIAHLLTKGRSFTNPVFKEFKTGDVITCAQACIRVKSCRSINFNDETHVCQLFDVSGTPSIFDKNGVYSEIDSWPSQTDPHCYNRPCENDEICISGSMTDDGSCSFSCFKNARSCPVPIGGYPVDQARTGGSIFRHTCDRGYVGGDSAICLMTGEWNKTLDTNCALLFENQCEEETDCLPINGTCQQNMCKCGTGLEYDTSLIACVNVLFENQCDEETDCLPINGTCQQNICKCGSGQKYDTSLVACVNECPLLWILFQQQCYLFIDDMHTFDDAYDICAFYNSSVVYVETMEENEFLKSKMRRLNPNGGTIYWNGLYAGEDGYSFQWKTLNGKLEPKFYDWKPSEPNSLDEHCVVFFADRGYNYRWADILCDSKAKLVCKKIS